MTIEVSPQEIEVVSGDILEITSSLPETDVDVSQSITALVEPQNYVLAQAGIQNGGDPGVIPEWILEAVTNVLKNGDGNVMDILKDMQTLFDSLAIGVNQTISRIQTAEESMSALQTSVVSRLNGNEAAILNLDVTQVTPEHALAISMDAMQSTFGPDARAFIGSIASTYVDTDSAIAQDVSLLTAELNGLSASIETIDEALIEQAGALGALGTTTEVTLAALQNQIDGAIDSWYYSYVPSAVSAPWAAWIATDTANGNTLSQDAHTGDLFYNLVDGTAYRFAKSGTVFGWSVVTDTAITLALEKAANAQSTADGKASIYYKTAVEMNTIVGGWTAQQKLDNIGDTWVNSATSIVSTWSGSSWINAETRWSSKSVKKLTGADGSNMGFQLVSAGDISNPTAADRSFTVVADSFKVLGSNQATWNSTTERFDISATAKVPFSIDAVSGKIKFNGLVEFSNIGNVPAINKTYSQTSTPTSGMIIGDVWIDTDDNNKVYTYTSAGWTPPPAGVKTYAQAGPIYGMVAGDIWYDTANNNKISRWSGSSWVLVNSNVLKEINGDNGNITTIEGGKIKANTIRAADINTDTAMINLEIKSNDFPAATAPATTITNIAAGSPGFRLKANAASTFNDPDIYGSFIRGGKLAGDMRKVIVFGNNNEYERIALPSFSTMCDGNYDGQGDRFKIHVPISPYNDISYTENRFGSLNGCNFSVNAFSHVGSLYACVSIDSYFKTPDYGPVTTAGLTAISLDDSVKLPYISTGTEGSYLQNGVTKYTYYESTLPAYCYSGAWLNIGVTNDVGVNDAINFALCNVGTYSSIAKQSSFGGAFGLKSIKKTVIGTAFFDFMASSTAGYKHALVNYSGTTKKKAIFVEVNGVMFMIVRHDSDSVLIFISSFQRMNGYTSNLNPSVRTTLGIEVFGAGTTSIQAPVNKSWSCSVNNY